MNDVRLLMPDLLQGTQVPLFEMRLAAYNEIVRLKAGNDELRSALNAMMAEWIEHDGFISPETFARARTLLSREDNQNG